MAKYPHRYKSKRHKLMNLAEFKRGLEHAYYTEPITQKAFLVLLYYTAARVSEILNMKGADLQVSDKYYITIKRLKKSKQTPPLELRLSISGGTYLSMVKGYTLDEDRLFPFCRINAYRLTKRVFEVYPHFFRMNRITSLMKQNVPLNEIQNYTGLSMGALNFYVAKGSIARIGEIIQ